MALLKNSKLSNDQNLPGLGIHYEVYDELSADDVVAFMAISEAERRYGLQRAGLRRDTQTPSDRLKSYLMRLED